MQPSGNVAMIVIMQPGATPDDVQQVVHIIRERGLRDHVIVGTERTVVAVIGDERPVDLSVLESMPTVDASCRCWRRTRWPAAR